MNGIVAYGSYLPYFRLDRKSIGDALASGGGKGTRTVASYDEDTTSMGVEAARAALRGAPRVAPAAVYFATADPAYLDKTNATAIHAALSLDDSAMAFEWWDRSDLGRAFFARPSTRAGRRWPSSPTSARGCRVAGTSATAVTPRWRSCSPPATRARPCSPSTWRRPRLAPSSSSAGASPAMPPRASGKSASGSTPTCRWPTPPSRAR